MSKALITEQYLTDIADSIRAQLGVATEYKPSEMSAAIDSISGGGGGGVTALIDEEKKQDSGSTLTLDRTATITNAGYYYVIAFGYATSLSVYINGTAQTLDYQYSTDYINAYAKKVALNANDTVRIYTYGSGHAYLRALVLAVA